MANEFSPTFSSDKNIESYYSKRLKISVMITHKVIDGDEHIHMSIAKRGNLPNYDECSVAMKELAGDTIWDNERDSTEYKQPLYICHFWGIKII